MGKEEGKLCLMIFLLLTFFFSLAIFILNIIFTFTYKISRVNRSVLLSLDKELYLTLFSHNSWNFSEEIISEDGSYFYNLTLVEGYDCTGIKENFLDEKCYDRFFSIKENCLLEGHGYDEIELKCPYVPGFSNFFTKIYWSENFLPNVNYIRNVTEKENYVTSGYQSFLSLYESYSYISESGNICPIDYKNCGIIDTLGKVLCLRENEECPITDIKISIQNDGDLISMGYKERKFKHSDVSLYYTNKERRNNFIPSIYRLSKETPCIIDTITESKYVESGDTFNNTNKEFKIMINRKVYDPFSIKVDYTDKVPKEKRITLENLYLWNEYLDTSNEKEKYLTRKNDEFYVYYNPYIGFKNLKEFQKFKKKNEKKTT